MGARVGILLNEVAGLNFNVQFSAIVERALPYLKDASEYTLDIILREQFNNAYHLDASLGRLYSLARDTLLTQDFYFTSINVLFNASQNKESYDVLFFEESLDSVDYSFKKQETFTFDTDGHRPVMRYSSLSQDQYRVSALGGTFDHIHDGHKILLSVASFITNEKLIVGLTDEELLVNKQHKNLLEPFHTRSANVLSFLQLVKPTLKIEVIAIRDVCGPTGTVPDIQALVVSRETLNGGKTVNKTRKERGLSELDIIVVNVLGGREDDGWKEKLSSTELRHRHLKKLGQ